MYNKWQEASGYRDFLNEASKVDEIKKLRNGQKQYEDYYHVGGNHWLMVALGLAYKYSYKKGTFEEEVKFIKENQESLNAYLIVTLKDNSDTTIRSKNRFFDTKFVTQAIKSLFPHFKEEKQEERESLNQQAIEQGCIPAVVMKSGKDKFLEFEGNEYENNKELFTKNYFLNNCIVLVPGFSPISAQNPYTVLYGRLIQYALVFLESPLYWKQCLVLKINGEYDDKSWLMKETVQFNTVVTIQDPICEMTERDQIKEFLKRIEKYKTLQVNDYEANKESVERDLEKALKEQQILEKMVYQEYQDFLNNSLKKIKEHVSKKSKITQKQFEEEWNQQQKIKKEQEQAKIEEEKPKQTFWGSLKATISDWWKRGKTWIIGGTAVTAVGAVALYKYLSSTKPKPAEQK